MKKVIVFDFDGVIVPSEEIKVKGYEWMFSEHGEEVPLDAIREARSEFAEARGNRFDIIRSIFQRLGHGDLEERTHMYAQRFGAIVQSRINALRVDTLVMQMLEKYSRTHRLYINSNNPDESLRETVRALGIEHFFTEIYGSSHTKFENLRTISEREHVGSREIVFIGDGEGDRKAAEEFGCSFVGVGTNLNGWREGEQPFPVMSSLSEFERRYGDSWGKRMV